MPEESFRKLNSELVFGDLLKKKYVECYSETKEEKSYSMVWFTAGFALGITPLILFVVLKP